MANILNIAKSGLNAFQRALDVTGNNIANVGTSGYSRQTIEFRASSSMRFAGAYVGSGVLINSIKRNNDRFATQQVRETLTAKSQYETFFQQASQIDKLLSQDGTNVSKAIQSFFSAVNQLNDAPDNLASRGVMLNQSQLMVEQFNSLQKNLAEYQSNNTAQVSEVVAQINLLTKDIATVNSQLTTMRNSPELLDKRDELLKELSKYVNVTVIDQGDSGISVGIGNGEVLVTGSQQRDLAVITGANGQGGTRIAIKDNNTSVDMTENLHSGMLGGLLDFENNVINQASQLLGQMAIGLAGVFNTQHRLGLDMNNLLGKDFFTDFNAMSFQLARSVPDKNNTGTASLSVAIDNVSQTRLSDYQLIVTDTGTNEIRLIRQSDGQSTTLNWTNTPPAPPAGQFQIDGLTIQVDDVGNLSNGDRFNLSPLKGAARDLSLQISDAREIAMASPVRIQSALANTGNAPIKLGDLLNTASVDKSYRIEFVSDTQFNVVNVTDAITSGPFTFTPNTDNTIMIPDSITPSYSVILSGLPKAGDTFTADYNTGGVGDNSNGLRLGAIQSGRIFEGQSESIFDRYAGLLANVGSRTNQAQTRSEAADILYNQATDFRNSKSGVDYNEEAANLIYFKQAFEAAGQLLSVSSQIMDYLFAAIR